jgi:hypothetical protein
MWDAEAAAKVVTTVVVPVLTLITLGGRRKRLRNEIKENLALVSEIEKHKVINEHTLAPGWLQGRITLDIARLSGINLRTPKRPVPKGTVVFVSIMVLIFGGWTYLLDVDDFVWYSIFPGAVAALLLFSVFGMFLNRQIPPEESDLPVGAVLAATDTINERVATFVAMSTSGNIDDRALSGGQVDVACKFVQLLQSGRYEDGLQLADDNWITCRIHAWLWGNREEFGQDIEQLGQLVQSMLADRENNPAWRDFVATESSRFRSTWGTIDLNQYGFASRRRRLAQNIELVILARTGKSEAYFVLNATALPNALTFVVIKTNGAWKVANHLGRAIPLPSWPPIWWNTGDPAIENLPEV